MRVYISFLILLFNYTIWGQEVTGILIQPTCAQSEDGSINLSVDNEFSPFEFTWTRDDGSGPIPFSFEEDQSHLSSLYEYCVEVTNSICGEAKRCFNFSPDYEIPFGLVPFGDNSLCSSTGPDACDGFIEISDILDPSSEQFPASFLWAGPSGFSSTDRNIYNLCPGEFSVSITTQTNCEYVLSRTICCCEYSDYNGQMGCPYGPVGVSLSSSANVANCTSQNQNDGQIDLIIFSGWPGVFVSWFNPEINPNGPFSFDEDLTTLPSGIYTVTINDGCNTINNTYYVGIDACLDELGNPILTIDDVTVQHGFPFEYNMPVENGKIILDIGSQFPLSHSDIKWYTESEFYNPPPPYYHPLPVHTGPILFDNPPGQYIVVISSQECMISNSYELLNCQGDLNYEVDYSETSYCIQGAEGEIKVEIGSHFPPYRAFLYKGDYSSYSLIPINEITSFNVSFSISGIDEPGVYYLLLTDNTGKTACEVQYIPCQCDFFTFIADNTHPCSNPLFAIPKIKDVQILRSNTSDITFPYDNYELWCLSHLNRSSLEFEITWPEPDSDVSIYTLDEGLISGPGEYVLEDDGNYTLSMKDEFGCVINRSFMHGTREEVCIADGGANLNDVLFDFYDGQYILDYDNSYVEIGCFNCEYCGPNWIYCGDYCAGYLGEAGPVYEVIPNSIDDPEHPCNKLSFICPLRSQDVTTVPLGSLYTQFINWESYGDSENRNCIYSCGCLYPPGTFPGETEPIWIETEILVPGIDCEEGSDPSIDPNSDCIDCSHPIYEPLLGNPDDCLTLLMCPELECEVTIFGFFDKCLFHSLDGTCDLNEYCFHNINYMETIAENVDCNSGYIDCADLYIAYNGKSDSNEVRIDTFYDTKLQVYPNPTSNQLVFRIISHYTGNFDLKIYNLLGEVIYHEENLASEKLIFGQVSVDNLASGTYLLSITTDESSYLKEFVKI